MQTTERVVDGVKYERSADPKFGSFWTTSATDLAVGVPTLMCDCGCKTFTIRQAHYDTWASCTQCGRAESIHSG